MNVDYSLRRQLMIDYKPVIEEHCNESNLYRYLKEITDKICNNNYRSDIVDYFNEAQHQCLRVWKDIEPSQNVYRNYICSIKENCSSDECSLIFCIVWAMFSLQKSLPEKVVWFLKAIYPLIVDYKHFAMFDEQVRLLRSQNELFETCFEPDPVLADEIYDNVNYNQFDPLVWHNVTNGFDENSIREIVGRYKRTIDKLNILELIEKNFDEYAPRDYNNNFDF